jgi:hypothetical protein
MLWLLVAVSSYILLAVTSLIDKVLLSGKLTDPKLYAFYIGILTAAAFLLLPFGVLAPVAPAIFFLGMVAGMTQIYGSYFYLAALGRFEASRVVPLIGSLVPIFGFFLTALVSGGAAVLSSWEFAGFLLLIAGGWLIMADHVSIKKKSLGLIFLAALFFALTVVVAKLVYLRLPFLNGFILIAFGSATAAVTFLLSKNVRRVVFGKHSADYKGKPNFLFFFGQGLGGAAFLLQSFAVSLAPQASVPVINAMAGVQYVFLFFFAALLSLRLPDLVKEKMTRAVFVQKTAAIILIMAGLAIFALN